MPLGLPLHLVKYGGSMLWAVAIYWMLAALAPRTGSIRIALLSLMLATGVECFKLVYYPALDTFRLTLAGKLLLGRIFAVSDIVAYAIGIAVVAWVDIRFRTAP